MHDFVHTGSIVYYHLEFVMIRKDTVEWAELISFTFGSNAKKSGLMFS